MAASCIVHSWGMGCRLCSGQEAGGISPILLEAKHRQVTNYFSQLKLLCFTIRENVHYISSTLFFFGLYLKVFSRKLEGGLFFGPWLLPFSALFLLLHEVHSNTSYALNFAIKVLPTSKSTAQRLSSHLQG